MHTINNGTLGFSAFDRVSVYVEDPSVFSAHKILVVVGMLIAAFTKATKAVDI
jgi:hypothetical protein